MDELEKAKQLLAEQEQANLNEAVQAYKQWVEKYGYQVSPYVVIKAGGIDANIEFVKVK